MKHGFFTISAARVPGFARVLGLLLSCMVAACDSPLEDPGSPRSEQTGAPATPLQSSGQVLSATGGGRYLLSATFDVQFSLSAVTTPQGKIVGQFHQELTADGLLVSFSGELTCMSVDSENGRAWIGGVITRNASEHPDFMGEIHQPGRDVWFRVLDQGQGGSEPDRLTFLGFEGSGGIGTSEEYCNIRIWPDGNARTHPVTSGDIMVQP